VASEVRQENPDLILERRLREEPYVFEFFQAVRLLEKLQPEREPVGRFAQPKREAARFSAHASLTFPASEIQSLDWTEGRPPRLEVNFMGLTGPTGVLPHYYTQLVQERNRAKDTGLRDFLDIFHHRIISLFYRAWQKHKCTVNYSEGGEDPIGQALLALIGLGSPGLQRRLGVADETLIFYGGLLGLIPRSATALENLLADYFSVPVEVEQFVGVWRPIAQPDQCQLEAGDEISRQLGLGAVAGDEVWDRGSRVRIKIGPLSEERYLDFLPTGSAWEPLNELTRFFAGGEIEFEVQLILQREDVPASELGRDGDAGPRLGWLTWVKSTPDFNRDPGDAILLLNQGS
jgi:type VI secretion system protein ImpH